MKFFAKLLIAALVLAVLLPFTIIKGKDGRPLMSLSKLKAPDLDIPNLPGGMKIPDVSPAIKNKDVVYKWRNERGELHFTSSPPPAGIEYTVKGYDPKTNLIQSVNIETKDPEPEVADPQDKSPSDIGNPYSPEKIKKLFDDAENIQKLLDDRMKKHEAMIGQ